MKKLVSVTFAFARFFGIVGAEKALFGSYYWLYFPSVIGREGVRGVCKLFLEQLVVFAVALVVYDLIGKDLFGVELLKVEGRVKIMRIRFIYLPFGTLSTQGKKRTKWSWLATVVEFAFFSWSLNPLFALLCMRKFGQKEAFWKGLLTIALGCAVVTLYWWKVYSEVILKIFAFVRHLIS